MTHPATVLLPPGLFGQAGFFTNEVVSALKDAASPKPVDIWQSLILFGVLAAGAGFLFLLAAYFRYYRKLAQLKLDRYSRPASPGDNSPDPGRLSSGNSDRRKRRRRRSDFLPRNPTLAETRGLPPRRAENRPPTF